MLTRRSAIGLRALIVGAVMAVVLSGQVLATTLPIVRQFAAPGGVPDGMTFVEGNLWVWDVGLNDAFHILDPLDGSIIASYPAPSTNGATGLAFDGQFLWGVVGGLDLSYLAKFDAASGAMIESYVAPIGNPTGLAFDGQYLWMSQIDGPSLAKVNPATLQVEDVYAKEPILSYDLAWDGSSLWLTGWDRVEGSSFYCIDPTTGDTTSVFKSPVDGMVGLAIKDGFLFASNTRTGMIYVLSIPEPASCFTGAVALCWLVRAVPVSRQVETLSCQMLKA